LGTTPEVWLNLQRDYDVEIAKLGIGKGLAKIKPIGGAPANDDFAPGADRMKA
jgi:plasmid maintenance system antidote protein VapI